MDDEFDDFGGFDSVETDPGGFDDISNLDVVEPVDDIEVEEPAFELEDELSGLEIEETLDTFSTATDISEEDALAGIDIEEPLEGTEEIEAVTEAEDELIGLEGEETPDISDYEIDTGGGYSGQDSPDDVKDPLQEMNDYMSEHNYGREDYAEYSQDPEYQAINDRLLENDGLDPVDYDAGKDPLQEMNDYMSEHNYGQEDYAEYSQDPEYQAINDRLLENDGLDPVDYDAGKDPLQEMNDYMSEHNYGQDDYAEYSQDPEYQAINDRLLEKDGLDPVDYDSVNESADSVSDVSDFQGDQIDDSFNAYNDEFSDEETGDLPLVESDESAEMPPEEYADSSDDIPADEYDESSEMPPEEYADSSDDIPAEEYDESAEMPPEEYADSSDDIPAEGYDESAEMPPEKYADSSDDIPAEGYDESSEMPPEEYADSSDDIPAEEYDESAEMSPEEYAESSDDIPAEGYDESAELPPDEYADSSDDVPAEGYDESAEMPPEEYADSSDDVPAEGYDESAEMPPEEYADSSDDTPAEEYDESAEMPPEEYADSSDDVPAEEYDESAEMPPEEYADSSDDTPAEEYDESAEMPPEEYAESSDDIPAEGYDESAEMPPEEYADSSDDIPADGHDESAEMPPEEYADSSDDIPAEEYEDVPGDVQPDAIPGELGNFVDDSDFEELIKQDYPEFYESGNFYVQGINEYGYEGTCGPTSQANAVNTVLGTNELTENKVLTLAVDNGLCETKSLDPEKNGATTTEDFMKLYDNVNDAIGGKLNIECFDYDKALSVDEMADKLDEGAVLNIAVDSATLWDENNHIPGMLSEDVCTDHWITVTGVERDADGAVIGFNIIDSGGGENYADVEKYERMCFGEEGRKMTDPTCIVVSKNDSVDAGKNK